MGFTVMRRISRRPCLKSRPYTYVKAIGCTTPSPPLADTAATSDGLLQGNIGPQIMGYAIPASWVKRVEYNIYRRGSAL